LLLRAGLTEDEKYLLARFADETRTGDR
jgi:hypothetical protein